MRKRRKYLSIDDTTLWSDAKSLIEQNLITPIVSNFISYRIFHRDTTEVAQLWANDIDSPLAPEDNRDLARVAHYYSIKESPRGAKSDYLNYLKHLLLDLAQNDPEVDQDLVQDLPNELDILPIKYKTKTFSETAHQFGYPKFENEDKNPLRLLAELPFSVYITTSYHNFLEVALTKVRPSKRPVSEIFYWNDALKRSPSIFEKEPDYEPTPERPLVYHLYGIDQHPESLVLTEDDHLDFLIKVSQMRSEVHGTGNLPSLPDKISIRLSSTALLLLGYRVYDWEFRALFKGLIQAFNEPRKLLADRSISVQITPETGQSKDKIKEYLKDFFEESYFDVYWGDAQACMQALWQLYRRTDNE